MRKCCSTCKYHDDFSWVCFNGESDFRADFTHPEHQCSYWKGNEQDNEDNGKRN